MNIPWWLIIILGIVFFILVGIGILCVWLIKNIGNIKF